MAAGASPVTEDAFDSYHGCSIVSFTVAYSGTAATVKRRLSMILAILLSPSPRPLSNMPQFFALEFGYWQPTSCPLLYQPS